MKKNEVKEITQAEAIKAIEAVKGEIIHCFIRMFGAGWDKNSVLDLIKKSKRIAWADNMFNHNLAVINEGKLYNFDITPEIITNN